MNATRQHIVKPGDGADLSKLSPDATPLINDKASAKEASAKMQERLAELQDVLFAEQKNSILIVFQGMDTSGKDGAVRHVCGGFNPAGVRVVSFKRPTVPELQHDFLWRVHSQTPGTGEIVIFNRSHYEDVLVVRVHELVAKERWKARYDAINAFERNLASEGTTILKFFLHISKEEQGKRLQDRLDDPDKHWKFQHGDLDERKLWTDYQKAYEEALERTSTEWAPWHVIPADAKWYRNFSVGAIIIEKLESLKMAYPKIDLSKEVIE